MSVFAGRLWQPQERRSYRPGRFTLLNAFPVLPQRHFAAAEAEERVCDLSQVTGEQSSSSSLHSAQISRTILPAFSPADGQVRVTDSAWKCSFSERQAGGIFGPSPSRITQKSAERGEEGGGRVTPWLKEPWKCRLEAKCCLQIGGLPRPSAPRRREKVKS